MSRRYSLLVSTGTARLMDSRDHRRVAAGGLAATSGCRYRGGAGRHIIGMGLHDAMRYVLLFSMRGSTRASSSGPRALHRPPTRATVLFEGAVELLRELGRRGALLAVPRQERRGLERGLDTPACGGCSHATAAGEEKPRSRTPPCSTTCGPCSTSLRRRP